MKDSFQDLDLSELGFEKLFEASWLWHEFSAQPIGAGTSDIQWIRVVSFDELQHWESAWSKTDGAGDAPRIFYPSLLTDHTVTVLAGFRGKKLIAGGIANTSEAVAGLSNVFAPSNHESQVWADLLGNVQALFPGKHVVGYEHGENLEAALECGFEAIGKLNVWLRRE